MREHFCILVCYFSNENETSVDAGLDRDQYRFQPIKFVNSVVPSPCETAI